MPPINRLLMLTLAASAAGAGSASAQDTARVSAPVAASAVATDDTTSTSSPRMAPTGVRRVAEVAGAAALAQKPQSMGKPMAMMIVGGAAFVLGALIGDPAGSLFMIGGAVAFLIGLYEYVR